MNQQAWWIRLLKRKQCVRSSLLSFHWTRTPFLGLGPQAVQVVMDSANPLSTLKQLSQDFPRYASSIARRVVASDNITDEATRNSMRTQTGLSLVWLNGALVSADKMNPFQWVSFVSKFVHLFNTTQFTSTCSPGARYYAFIDIASNQSRAEDSTRAHYTSGHRGLFCE